MIKRTYPKVEEFRDLIAVNFDSMQADRLQCQSDNEFGAKYGISGSTVRKYMGSNGKGQAGVHNITLDVEEVNAMREHHKDKYVADHYGCSTITIIKRCGSRKSLSMNHATIGKENTVIIKDSVKSINERLAKETKVVRNEIRWEYPDEKPYWITDEVIIAGDAPIPGIKFEKNTIGHLY